MSRDVRVKEIALAYQADHKGSFTAAGLMIDIHEGFYNDTSSLEIDHKRLYEDNEGFEVCIEDVNGYQHVHYERTCGYDPEVPLNVIIHFHHKD